MINFRTFLQEKTFNIQKDVDWLYKVSGFEKFVGYIKDNKYRDILTTKVISDRNKGVMFSCSSNDLKTKYSKQASKLNPVIIELGISKYEDFVKSSVKRLDREKLLPKAMRKIPSYKELNNILSTY